MPPIRHVRSATCLIVTHLMAHAAAFTVCGRHCAVLTIRAASGPSRHSGSSLITFPPKDLDPFLGRPARIVDTDVVRPTDASSRVLNLDFIPRLGWRGTVFPSVLSPVLCSIFSAACVLWAHYWRGFRGIDSTAHTVLGVLVSFLTVFRTQQASSRYWEGRGQLGMIMAGVVDAASLSSIHLGDSHTDPERQAAKRELARLLRLYFRETVRFLRRMSRETQRVSNYWLPEDAIAAVGEDRLACDIEATEEECAALLKASRPPVLVLRWVRAHLYKAGVEGGLLMGQTTADRQQARATPLTRARTRPSCT